MDYNNCGVFCMMFLQKYLLGQPLDVTIQDIENCRLDFANKIMLFEQYLEGCCPSCGFTCENEETIECYSCNRQFHFKPYCVEADLKDSAAGNFTCRLCKINHWPVKPSIKQTGKTVHFESKKEALEELQKLKDEDVIIVDCEDRRKEKVDIDLEVIDTAGKETGIECKRTVEARNKPKRKRTSFFYPQLIKKKKPDDEKLYCVCRKPYKKSDCMWCCDTCEEWFHPRCIGRDDKETPPRKDTAFMCIPCLKEHLKNWPVQRLKDLVQFDDEDLEDEGDMISMKAVEKHMLKVYERCWYIVRLEGKNSDVPWMKRHLMYVKEMGLPSSTGFGEALFSQQAIYMIKINLTNRFQEKKKKSGIYSIHYTMPSMANDELRTSFEEEIGESENYIQKVLLKEAMVVIVQEGTEDNYDAVNAELQKTESKKRITANYLLLNYMVKEREEYLKKLQSLKYD